MVSRAVFFEVYDSSPLSGIIGENHVAVQGSNKGGEYACFL